MHNLKQTNEYVSKAGAYPEGRGDICLWTRAQSPTKEGPPPCSCD